MGGVLEHPAESKAFPAHGLRRPMAHHGWQRDMDSGGWVAYVEQRWYGHRARKATWLYAVRCELPDLRWGLGPPPMARISEARAEARGRRLGRPPTVERMGRRERSATPVEFRDVLIAMARSVGFPQR